MRLRSKSSSLSVGVMAVTIVQGSFTGQIPYAQSAVAGVPRTCSSVGLRAAIRFGSSRGGVRLRRFSALGLIRCLHGCTSNSGIRAVGTGSVCQRPNGRHCTRYTSSAVQRAHRPTSRRRVCTRRLVAYVSRESDIFVTQATALAMASTAAAFCSSPTTPFTTRTHLAAASPGPRLQLRSGRRLAGPAITMQFNLGSLFGGGGDKPPPGKKVSLKEAGVVPDVSSIMRGMLGRAGVGVGAAPGLFTKRVGGSREIHSAMPICALLFAQRPILAHCLNVVLHSLSLSRPPALPPGAFAAELESKTLHPTPPALTPTPQTPTPGACGGVRGQDGAARQVPGVGQECSEPQRRVFLWRHPDPRRRRDRHGPGMLLTLRLPVAFAAELSALGGADLLMPRLQLHGPWCPPLGLCSGSPLGTHLGH